MAETEPGFMELVMKSLKDEIDSLLEPSLSDSFSVGSSIKEDSDRISRIYHVKDHQTFFYGLTLGNFFGIANGISMAKRGHILTDEEGVLVKELIEEYAKRIQEKVNRHYP